MFDTTKDDLKAILRSVHEGRIQLPDFQRDYVWNDSDVRSLIASIAKGFPVGALLTLQTGGDVQFKPRMIAGTPDLKRDPEWLLLDGQQRVTSLYQSMFSSNPLATKNDKDKKIERFYYISINDAVNGNADLESAIIGVPADRVLRSNFGKDIETDVSSAELEFAKDLFPLNQVFDNREWFYGWKDYWRARGRDTSDLEREFYRKVIEIIDDYKMPLIQLDRTNSREAICLVFEKVNVGGKKLDAFELVTAIFAAESFDLRDDWIGVVKKPGRKARIAYEPNTRHLLTQLASTDFLQACSIMSTRGRRLEKEAEGKKDKELPQISCRRDAILALPLADYKEFAPLVEQGFIKAAGLLNELKLYWHYDLPYPPLLVTLATVYSIGGDALENKVARDKLKQWFWCVTFGEIYGSSTETRIARDAPELAAWILNGDPQPRSMDEAIFQADRLNSLRTRISGAYKGIHALLMSHGAQDFVTGRPTDIMTFMSDKIDVHHIFPEAWCKANGIAPQVYNSIINKSPLSFSTNRSIGGSAPSIYLKRIEEKHGMSSEQLDQILATHLIEPKHLRSDDFEAFFASRKELLTAAVSAAMQKQVVGASTPNEAEYELDEASEDNEGQNGDEN